MRTVRVELPEALVDSYVEYADEHGRQEGRSVFALVLARALAYDQLLLRDWERVKTDALESIAHHTERLERRQWEREKTEREKANMRANGLDPDAER